jgi:hypothetical protein
MRVGLSPLLQDGHLFYLSEHPCWSGLGNVRNAARCS